MASKRSPTLSSWQAMLTRCYNTKANNYPKYGGSGIIVCEFLRNNHTNLIAAIGERPIGKTLNRIDNRSSYTCGMCAECLSNNWPLNVNWATRTEQNRNQNDLHFITLNGVTKCLSEWAEEFGLSDRTVRSRIRYGVVGKALFAPTRRKLMVNVGGHLKSIADLASEIGIDQSSVRARLRRGLNGEFIYQPKSDALRDPITGRMANTLLR